MSEPSGDPLPREHLFGLDFVDAATLDPVVAVLAAREPGPADDGSLPVVVTPNVDHLVRLDRATTPESARLAAAAAWVLPDGQPIVWASRILGRPLRARLAGSDLVTQLFPALVATGRTVVVVATSDQVATLLRAEGDHVHPIVAPMLRLEDRDGIGVVAARTAALVQEVGASHVFVTLGFPKQDLVIDELLARLPSDRLPVLLAVGASFDMHYGLVRRAPGWMQRCGLEWSFRFIQEPRRLFRRYFVDDPAFVGVVWREWRATRQASVARRHERRRFEA